jgi:hypothetical protein
MPFIKGQSGNPNGRPPVGFAVAERIRKACGSDAGVLVDELMRLATTDKSASIRLAAITLLLERGFGKAPQPIELPTSGDIAPRVFDVSKLSDATLAALLAEMHPELKVTDIKPVAVEDV